MTLTIKNKALHIDLTKAAPSISIGWLFRGAVTTTNNNNEKIGRISIFFIKNVSVYSRNHGLPTGIMAVFGHKCLSNCSGTYLHQGVANLER